MAVLNETFVPSENDTEKAKAFSRILAREFAPESRVSIQRENDGESIEIPRPVFMISIYTPRAISAVREMRQRLRNPPKDVDDFLGTLHQQGLPQTVSKLSDFAESL